MFYPPANEPNGREAGWTQKKKKKRKIPPPCQELNLSARACSCAFHEGLDSNANGNRAVSLLTPA
jgi:hypothetical protein